MGVDAIAEGLAGTFDLKCQLFVDNFANLVSVAVTFLGTL